MIALLDLTPAASHVRLAATLRRAYRSTAWGLFLSLGCPLLAALIGVGLLYWLLLLAGILALVYSIGALDLAIEAQGRLEAMERSRIQLAIIQRGAAGAERRQLAAIRQQARRRPPTSGSRFRPYTGGMPA